MDVISCPVFARKSSAKRCKGHSSPVSDGPRISVEEVDSAITEEEPAAETPSEPLVPDAVSEDGYESDTSSGEDTDDDFISPRQLFVEAEDQGKFVFNPFSAGTAFMLMQRLDPGQPRLA